MDPVNEPLSQQDDKYEVLLSFSRGKDNSQETFASCLCSSLRKAGISVLKDDIPIELLPKIIESLEISVIIFSKHYASSKRCLEELTKIMEFRKAYDQVVLPIFYGVDRFEVRNKTFSFGEAFQDLVQRFSPTEDEVSRWCTALSDAGSFYGIVVPNFESRNESEYIHNIVERVRHILDRKNPFASEGLVGVSSQMQEVIAMLHNHHSKDLLSIGIYGRGGIGKTTIAKVIFNRIQYDFESTYFLSDVWDAWARKGKVHLQNELLSVVCESTDMRLDSFESASLQLNSRLWHKKVLLVLDDATHLDQLHALCGNHAWFGRGSRIIITAGDLHLLQAFQVDDVYSMKLLSDHESLELFSRKAFKQVNPEGESLQLCRRGVAYTEGLPLALEVLGSFLNGRSPMEWESSLMKLSIRPSHDICDILKLSFDSLEGNEKEIFLNIVLFYIGGNVNDVIQELDGHGWNASFGIRVLVDRSLVTIDKNNKLRMHNLLRLLGREIMRQNSQNELLNRGDKYEVFLSFRGPDTRATFTSHLHSALRNAGIIVFKDDEFPRGNHINPELFRVIGSSKISIIIFSRAYAGSEWCLDELSLIMELHKSNDHVVLPVFYDVHPSEIRHQTSSFGDAFEDLIQRSSPPEVQVSKWRAALRQAGDIAGIVVLGSSDESKNVNDVVENVCGILDKNDLFVADHPVGVNNRVKEVIKMFQNHKSKDVIMVGIWGMGGIGKTTVAKAISNELGCTFEKRSYLSNIREVWDREEGQLRLQNQLLSDICTTTKMKIHSVDSGRITLRDRLRHKKALVVLDDVDKSAQLSALVGSRDWFKPGSIIIITTRNRRLLHKMDCIYSMKNLDKMESVELFSWHAFKQESPKEDFIELSKKIVTYSGGLPLALEVLGSYLFDREVKEWKRVLKELEKIPNEMIQKKLKISFDGLNDSQKEIFLDISCFFIGMDKYDVTQILNGCGFSADLGIKILMERSLVTIDEKNMLGMHDLLRNMGREIIRQQSQNEPGKRSRLWFLEDALTILLRHKGTKAIEGLSLKLSQKLHFRTEAFKKMKRLRLLHLDNVRLRGDYKYISDDLRWLCWHGFPIKYIPSNFYQEELVAIDLKYSNLRQVWKEPQLLKRLKILNLSHSRYLMQTPDFSKVPNLEKLILKDCPNLSVIHHSIGLLGHLLLLDLEDCIGLPSLPRSIYELKCLNTLILSGCKMIKKLEDEIEQMESLTTLIAPTIEDVPFSLVRLKSIRHLSICGYEGLSNHGIPSLFRSWISATNNPLPPMLTEVAMSSSISCDMVNSICGPSAISSSVTKQRSLLLENELKILDSLCATKCTDIMRLEDCVKHRLIQIAKDSQVFCTLSDEVSQGILPGCKYPYWLTFKGEGDSVKFKIPPVNEFGNLKGLTICCVYFPSGDLGNKACDSCIISLMIINYTKATTLRYKQDSLTSFEEAKRKAIMSNLESNDQVEVIAIVGNGFTMKKIIVYLIYNESFEEQTSPSKATNSTGTKHKCEEEEAHPTIRPNKAMKI